MPKKGKGRYKGKTKIDNMYRKKIMIRIVGNLR
jgi:hypothetical protein